MEAEMGRRARCPLGSRACYRSLTCHFCAIGLWGRCDRTTRTSCCSCRQARVRATPSWPLWPICLSAYVCTSPRGSPGVSPWFQSRKRFTVPVLESKPDQRVSLGCAACPAQVWPRAWRETVEVLLLPPADRSGAAALLRRQKRSL